MSDREELRRLRELLAVAQRLAQVGSWEWDVATNEVAWSDQLYRIYGVDPRTFVPSFEKFLSLVHPADRERVASTIQEALVTGHPLHYELRALRPDGSVRVLEARAEVSLDDSRRVVRVVGTAQDITERRVIEDELRHEQETLELVGRATNDMIWDWDLQTGRVERSRGMEAYGYGPGDVRGDNAWFAALLHPEDAAAVKASLAAALESGATSWSEGFRLRRKDGSYASVVDRGHIVRDAAGRAIRMAGSLLDVTERDRAQELAKRSAASAELLSRASHELRTPLNAILGFSELLEQRLDQALGPRERRYLQNIRSSGEHLLRLIDRLLQVAKADSGRLELRRTVMDLSALVEPVAANMSRAGAAAGVELTVAALPEVSIRVDHLRLATVLGELLTNAITATPTGGSVRLAATVPDGDLLLEVADTGRGIPEEAHDRIFGVFERIHDESRTGTGLGLALCRDLVELHGGTISFESETGRGTTFRVRIPHAAWARDGGARVLIVEDDPNDADLAMTICSEAGIRCEVVGSIAEALTSIASELPRAAIVDLHLPDGSGRDVLASLRAADASVPVLLVTAELDGPIRARRGERVTKPLNPERLRSWLLAATASDGTTPDQASGGSA